LASEDITRGELQISIPWHEVETEQQRILRSFRKQAKIPGFRPGKAPESLIRTRFAEEVRREVLEALVPKFFWKEAQAQDFRVVGAPNIEDVKFEESQPLEFRAEFEIVPDFELKEYRRLKVHYQEPQITEEEISAELERLRERQATFRNEDPRPLADGDIAVVSLKSDEVEGVPSVDQAETTLTIGSEETLADFTNALRGKSPGDKADFEVAYPEDFGNEKLAGKTIPFHAEVKGVRKKELPELDDNFAADVGDFRSLDELKERIKQELYGHRRRHAVEHAHEHIIDELIKLHDFPLPERMVQDQIRTRVERTARSLASQGINLEEMQLDWKKIAEEQRPRAERDVRAGLLLERIAEAEAIEAEEDEIDAQVERYAQQKKMSMSRARQELAESGALDNVRANLVNEKTLSYLFDESEKVEHHEGHEHAEGSEKE
jgi:trigger factor